MLVPLLEHRLQVAARQAATGSASVVAQPCNAGEPALLIVGQVARLQRNQQAARAKASGIQKAVIMVRPQHLQAIRHSHRRHDDMS